MKIVMIKKIFISMIFVVVHTSLSMQQEEFDPIKYRAQLLSTMEQALYAKNYYAFNRIIREFRKYLAQQNSFEKLSTCFDGIKATNNQIVKAKIALIAIDSYKSSSCESNENDTLHLDTLLNDFYSKNLNNEQLSQEGLNLESYHILLKQFIKKACGKPNISKKEAQPATLFAQQMVFRGLSNGRIKVYRPDNKKIQILDLFNQGSNLGHQDTVSALDLYDERYLISGSYDETIKLWDIKQGTCKQTIPTYELLHDRRNVTALLAGYQRLLAAGTLDGTLYLMNNLKYGIKKRPSYTTVKTTNLHDEKVSSLRKVNETHLVSSSYDTTCKITDLSTCQNVHTRKHSAQVNTVSLGNNFFISLIDNKVIELWDMKQKSPIFSFESRWPITTVTNNDKTIVLGLNNGMINVWDIKQSAYCKMFVSNQKNFKALELYDTRLFAFSENNSLHEIALLE